jgi:hypothetical protein
LGSLVDENPQFELLEERSEDGSPSLIITFPNGHQDYTMLSKFYSNDEDRLARLEHCNHIGHLANDPESTIAFTGCPGIDALEMTIMSKHLFGSPMIKWNLDGTVERIENPFNHPLINRETIQPRNLTNDSEPEFHVEDGDEMVNDELAEREEEIEIMQKIIETSAFCWWGWFGTSCGGGGSPPPSPPPDSPPAPSPPSTLPSVNTVQIRVCN